jgi:hypothetical protein
MQVACQLLNYKKRKFMNMQVSILLNQSDLDKSIHEGMAMSAPKFVSSTLLRICDPDPSSYGLGFSNLCCNELPPIHSMHIHPAACQQSRFLCFCLLVSVVQNWIQDMTERFPQTAASVPDARLDFERAKELKICAFVADFMKKYN